MIICTFSPLFITLTPIVLILLLLGFTVSFAYLYFKYRNNMERLQGQIQEQSKHKAEADKYKLMYQKQLFQYCLTNFDNHITLSEIYHLKEKTLTKSSEFVCILFQLSLETSLKLFDNNNNNNNNTMISNLEYICEKHYSNYTIRDFFPLSDTVAAIILSTDVINKQNLYSQCQSIMNEAVTEDSNYLFSCIIGKPVTGDDYIHSAYQTALETLTNKLPTDRSVITMYNELIEEEAEVVPYPLKLESDLLKEMRKNQVEACKALIKEYFDELQSSNYATLNDTFQQLIIMVRRIEKQSKLESMPFLCNVKLYQTQLSIEMMQNIITERIMDDMDELNEMNLYDNNKKKIVGQMISFINENAKNPNLNVDFVADNISLSKNYVRKIFKDVTRTNLSIYLQQVKIKQACLLLAKTDATVQDISEQLDFISNNYFFTFFKKHTGMTPVQYRLVHGHQRVNSI